MEITRAIIKGPYQKVLWKVFAGAETLFSTRRPARLTMTQFHLPYANLLEK